MALTKLQKNYCNFVTGINKYDPDWEEISLMLALATEVDELNKALPAKNRILSSIVGVKSTLNAIELESGDVIWTCIAIGNAELYGLNNNLIFGHLDIGYKMSTERTVNKVFPHKEQTLLTPLRDYPMKLVDITNKLNFKSFYTKPDDKYKMALYEATLDICTIVGAILSLYNHIDYPLTIEGAMDKNIKKLTKQIGMER